MGGSKISNLLVIQERYCKDIRMLLKYILYLMHICDIVRINSHAISCEYYNLRIISSLLSHRWSSEREIMYVDREERVAYNHLYVLENILKAF